MSVSTLPSRRERDLLATLHPEIPRQALRPMPKLPDAPDFSIDGEDYGDCKDVPGAVEKATHNFAWNLKTRFGLIVFQCLQANRRYAQKQGTIHKLPAPTPQLHYLDTENPKQTTKLALSLDSETEYRDLVMTIDRARQRITSLTYQREKCFAGLSPVIEDVLKGIEHPGDVMINEALDQWFASLGMSESFQATGQDELEKTETSIWTGKPREAGQATNIERKVVFLRDRIHTGHCIQMHIHEDPVALIKSHFNLWSYYTIVGTHTINLPNTTIGNIVAFKRRLEALYKAFVMPV